MSRTMMRRLLCGVGISLAALTVAIPARADGSLVDGSQSHLPALSATTTYYAGSSMADQIRAYRASGRYVTERTAIVNRARAFLDEWLREDCSSEPSCKPAVVFDMDDTLVSWYSLMDASDFAPQSSVTGPVLDQCLTPRINATMALLDHAERRGVKVFVITGRTESQRAVTQACLQQIGADDVRLILRQEDEMDLTATEYKSAARARIERAGWRIALSLGDQVSDSAGGHTDGRFVVPNPMYFIP